MHKGMQAELASLYVDWADSSNAAELAAGLDLALYSHISQLG
jgi:hypothetical protein